MIGQEAFYVKFWAGFDYRAFLALAPRSLLIPPTAPPGSSRAEVEALPLVQVGEREALRTLAGMSTLV